MQRARLEVEKALVFVQEHLDQPISVAQVAKAAGLSEFHLHRVFHEAVGESVGQFITRKRMETGALRLIAEPRAPISTIALEVGYSSTSNFSKAFRAFFGLSPSALRAPGAACPATLSTLVKKYGHELSPGALFSDALDDGEATRREAHHWDSLVRFDELGELPLTCLASPNGYALEQLLTTWEELIGSCTQLGICEGAVDAWGMAQESPDFAAPAFLRYYACVNGRPDIPVPRPLFRRVIPAGRFAVFTYDGPTDGVAAAYRSIYRSWFPRSSVAPADYTPLDHYVGDWPADGRVTMDMYFRLTSRG